MPTPEPFDPLAPKNLVHLPGKGIPDPDQRSAMAKDALKAQGIDLNPIVHLTDAEAAQAKMEMITVEHLQRFAAEIQTARRNGFFGVNPNMPKAFRAELEQRVMQCLKDSFAPASKEELHIMLCSIMLGVWMEYLDGCN